MGPMPLLPAMRLVQVVSTSPPSGVTSPRPVTTTRRIQSLLAGTGERLPDMGRRRPFVDRPGRGAVLQNSTRRARRAGSGLVRLDIVDGVADRPDLLGGIVRNLDAELLLEGHDELDDVEAVGTQIVDEARFLGHLVGFDAEMLDDDFLHAIGGLAHVLPFPRWYFCQP